MAKPYRDSTTSQARRRIKEYILAEGLRPGDALPTENALVELLGVSRSSVREAIRTLSALDVVEVRHGTGTFVGNLTLEPLVEGLAFRGMLMPGDDLTAVSEVLEIRIALDMQTAHALCAAMQGNEHPELRQLVDTMTELSQRGESFAEADRAFHTQLLGLTGNSLYGQLVGAFWDLHQVIAPSLGVATPVDIHDTAVAHGAMLDALEAGDEAAYRAAVLQHYAPLQRVLSNPAKKGKTA